MQRYRITITYDGTAYLGWQVQPHGVTVQSCLEAAIGKLTGETVKVHGSGRTDQGVHARGQVAHFDLEKEWTPAILHKALNSVLPSDVRILHVATAAAEFHARRSVVEKEYRYFIWNGTILPPFYRNYKAHVRAPLDVQAMRAAALHMVGKHDFAAFTANPHREVESTVREVTALHVRKHGADLVISVCGEGFLYRMARSIAGLLIRVGEGAVAQGEVQRILASRLRTARVPTAPACGLFLWNVKY
jgi:tRNA pseudouridine38-40 synthase